MAAISRMQQQEMTDIVQPLRSRQSVRSLPPLLLGLWHSRMC
jgi:hypothetical protein